MTERQQTGGVREAMLNLPTFCSRFDAAAGATSSKRPFRGQVMAAVCRMMLVPLRSKRAQMCSYLAPMRIFGGASAQFLRSQMLAFCGATVQVSGVLYIPTCTILNGPPNAVSGKIHDRMPVILPPSAWEAWLSPELMDAARVRDLASVMPAEEMEAYPVANSATDEVLFERLKLSG